MLKPTNNELDHQNLPRRKIVYGENSNCQPFSKEGSDKNITTIYLQPLGRANPAPFMMYTPDRSTSS